MIRVLSTLCLVLLLLAGGLGMSLRQHRAQVAHQALEIRILKEGLDRAAKTRKRDQATLALRLEENRLLARSEAAARASLAAAAASAPAWAEAPVPQEVRDALLAPLP